ncbi:MAG TPA: putative porin [Myxococcota bacterium]|nr:putative porin [Myxococcota bacterium]
MSHSPVRAGCILLWAALLCAGAAARADDAQPPKPSDATAGMLEAMREKGIISEQEYEDLYKRQAIYEIEQQQRSALPAWMTGWTVGGDATVRWDEIDRGGQLKIGKVLNAQNDPVDLVNGVASAKHERFRFRLRLGAEHTVGEDFLVGFRLATGQASAWAADPFLSNGFDLSRHYAFDPRSAFVTMGDYFAPKGIGIDRLYITWAPHLLEGFTASAGKMQNPFVSDNFSGDILVFDHDISPEGVQVGYKKRFFDELAWLNLNFGYYRIDEIVQATVPLNGNIGVPAPTNFPDIDEKDPFMYSWQIEGGGDITPILRVGGRVSYYDLRDINARTAAAMEFLGNGGDAINHNPLFAPAFAPGFDFPTNGASRGHARELVYDVFTKITPWEGWSIVPWFQLTHMLDASSENYGYDAGFDVFLPTNTQLTFMYASMPRNGTISIFTDFDFFEGFVNARGWGITVIQNINRWVSITGQFYTSEQRNVACGIPFNGIGPNAALCDESVWNNPVLSLYRRQILDREHFFVDLQVKF